jgi:hypothetical protein
MTAIEPAPPKPRLNKARRGFASPGGHFFEGVLMKKVVVYLVYLFVAVIALHIGRETGNYFWVLGALIIIAVLRFVYKKRKLFVGARRQAVAARNEARSNVRAKEIDAAVKPRSADGGSIKFFRKKKTAEDLNKTIKGRLLARDPPWQHVPSAVIDTIIARITDKGLLEAFVLHSMKAGLVTRYEAIEVKDSSQTVIAAELSMILCQAANRAMPELARALERKNRDEGFQALSLAGDFFEAAIALESNQTVGYLGLATIYGWCGKRALSHDWARRGLAKLDETRDTPAGFALRASSLFPADTFEQEEQQFRALLNDET